MGFLINHGNNSIDLIKDNNIKVVILGPDKKIYRTEFFEKENSSGKNTMKNIYGSTMFNGWFCSEGCDQENYPNKIYISINGENGWFADIEYNSLENSFTQVNKTKDSEILHSVIPPLVITGAPGGGTSFITKLLRNRGLYAGTDCGEVTIRKPHESNTFRSLKEIFYISKGNRLEMDSDDNFIRLNELIRNNTDTLIKLYRDQLEYKFSTFWGNESCKSIWGWKHPFNGSLMPILKNVFPNLKLVVIKRNKEKLSKKVHDIQGNWFRTKASDFLLNSFMNPDVSDLKKENVFYCNFNETVTNLEKVNELLSWIGLHILQSEEEFEIFMNKIGYEGQ